MKKIIRMALKLSCGAMGAVILGIVEIAVNRTSSFGIYEPKMPSKLIPKD